MKKSDNTSSEFMEQIEKQLALLKRFEQLLGTQTTTLSAALNAELEAFAKAFTLFAATNQTS